MRRYCGVKHGQIGEKMSCKHETNARGIVPSKGIVDAWNPHSFENFPLRAALVYYSATKFERITGARVVDRLVGVFLWKVECNKVQIYVVPFIVRGIAVAVGRPNSQENLYASGFV